MADYQNILDQWIIEHRDEMVEELKGFVRIPSVSRADLCDEKNHAPYGPDVRRMLDYALERGRYFGFRTEDHDGYCGSVLFGEGEHEIGFVAHLDVVPEGNGWIYAPYDPVEANGFLIGRGGSDNKGAAVMALFLMKFLKENQVPMKKTFRLMLGCAEETGMADFRHYIAAGGKVPEFGIVADSGFPVCYAEKGGYNAELYLKKGADILSFEAGNVRNAIPDLAVLKVRKNGSLTEEEVKDALHADEQLEVSEEEDAFVLTSHGKGGHAASPDGTENALVLLAKRVSKSSLSGLLDLSGLSFIAETFRDPYGTGMGFACEDEISGKLTSNAGVVRTESGELHLSLDIRYPVTADIQAMHERFEKYVSENGARLLDVDIEKAFYIDPEDEKVQILQKMYFEVTGDNKPPYTMGGGTYSRVIPNAITFGPGLHREKADFLPAGHGSAHGPDEALHIGSWLDAFRIYALSVLKLNELEF